MLDILNKTPAGLENLYRRMIKQIQLLDRRKLEFCRGVLSAAITTYRLLHLAELGILLGLPLDISSTYESITTIINIYRFFLIIQDNIVYTIHQSAQDFLFINKSIFFSAIKDIYYIIFSRSLQIISRILRHDIYSLGAPGFSIDQIKQPDPDLLAGAHYSCFYWIDYLLDTRRNINSNLDDNSSIIKFLSLKYLY
jgi:hypothetical protein